MDLNQRWVKISDIGQEVIPLQAWRAVGEELFIDRLSVIDIGLKLNRLAQAGKFPCLLPSRILLNEQTAEVPSLYQCWHQSEPPPHAAAALSLISWWAESCLCLWCLTLILPEPSLTVIEIYQGHRLPTSDPLIEMYYGYNIHENCRRSVL